MQFKKHLKEATLGEGEMKYAALSMAKELHTALATLTFIDMLSVMDPKNPAKKEVQELETMINKLTTEVGEFIQKYIPDVADAETDDTDELPKENLPDELSKEDKIKKVKTQNKELKEEVKMKSFKEFLTHEATSGIQHAISLKAAFKNAYTAAIKRGADVTAAKAAGKAAALRVQAGAKQ